MKITTHGSSEPRARLSDFLWGGNEPDLALHHLADGSQWLVRSRVARHPDGRAQRALEHFRIESGIAVAADRTHFEFDEHRFAEVAQYRGESGANLHEHPIVLPAVMELDTAVRPLPRADASVALSWCGPATLEVEGRSERLRVVCLRAGEAGQGGEQWLAEGIGEVCLGGVGTPHRWLVAWSSPTQNLFGGVAATWRNLVLPALPATDTTASRSSLF